MNKQINNWKYLTLPPSRELSAASNTMHHAAQFIALAGKHFLAEKLDDSHTTAEWNVEKSWLCGHLIRFPAEYVRVALDYINFNLLIINEKNKILRQTTIDGFTKNEIYSWLKSQLQNLGMDTEALSDSMHYEMPEHEVDEGEPYKIPAAEFLEELAKYRYNSHLLITKFAAEYKSARPVLVWPHHFDEGCYVPLQFDENEVFGSISFGMAVIDKYYNSPYFYVTAWKKEGLKFEELPPIQNPGIWHNNEWTGQVLTGEDLVVKDSNIQAEVAFNFMEHAIKNAQNIIGWEVKL